MQAWLDSWIKQAFRVCLLAAALVLAGSPAAMACSCIAQTEAEKRNNADIAFVGKVLSWEWSEDDTAIRQQVETKNPDLSEAELKDELRFAFMMRGRRTLFEITSAQKGISGTTVEIGHGTMGSLCGVTFEIGARYQVYAHDRERYYVTSLCAGSRRLQD